MKEFKGQRVKMVVDENSRDYFYVADVNKVDDTHIYFTDINGNDYGYRRDQIKKINNKINKDYSQDI